LAAAGGDGLGHLAPHRVGVPAGSDRLLLERIARRDATAVAELYDRHSRVLYGIALRILRTASDAEDVLQDVFVQIWEKAPLYDPARGKPMTWAITLTRNKSIDRLRSTQRRSRLQEEMQRESETSEQFDDRSSFEAQQPTQIHDGVARPHSKMARNFAGCASALAVKVATRGGCRLMIVRHYTQKPKLRTRLMVCGDESALALPPDQQIFA
jgi:RNA polymerase sigma factor (sigma-70 family)